MPSIGFQLSLVLVFTYSEYYFLSKDIPGVGPTLLVMSVSVEMLELLVSLRNAEVCLMIFSKSGVPLFSSAVRLQMRVARIRGH